VRAIAAFTPIPISPNAELTNEGIRLIGKGLTPVKKVDIWNRADVQTVLPMLTPRIASAVAELLPEKTADGREAWDIVNACLFRFVHGGDQTLIEEATPYLRTCRILMNDGPTTDDERILAVFVDRLLPFARGERIAALTPYRAPTLSDVYQSLNGSDQVREDYVKAVKLPWPGTLGASLEPFASVSDALDTFGYGDMVVIGDRVDIPLDGQSGSTIEVRFNGDGMRNFEELLSTARSNSAAGDDDTHSNPFLVTSGYHRFRVSLGAMPDGTPHSSFRRLHIPKVHTDPINYGFDLA
jgi:hypothetical protein